MPPWPPVFSPVPSSIGRSKATELEAAPPLLFKGQLLRSSATGFLVCLSLRCPGSPIGLGAGLKEFTTSFLQFTTSQNPLQLLSKLLQLPQALLRRHQFLPLPRKHIATLFL